MWAEKEAVMDTGFKMLKYLRETLGVTAVWFSMAVPVVVGSVGLSVDIGQAYLVRERLSRAVDAAALAAAAMSSEDPQLVEQKVNDFIEANYPEDKVGFTTDVEVVTTSDTVQVTAWASFNPVFGGVLGNKEVEIKVESEVTKEVKAIEVVLVMDVTGSMSTNNNIATLRTAAKSFVNTMFTRVSDHDMIKIGLVPFSSSVNVGRYGLGRAPTNLPYDTAFVLNPSGLSYSTTNTAQWGGCILEGTAPNTTDPYPDDIEDHEGPWEMYRYCRTRTGAAIPGCNTTRSGSRAPYTYTVQQNQNYNCPKTPVMPLTNKQSELLASIDTLKAEGNTYINNGLTWGLRLISPEFPFTEGESWNSQDWKKAIILMTDGESTMHSYYSIYGPTKRSASGTNPAVAGHTLDADDLDDRILDVCEDLRDKDVLVYTITFDEGVSSATKAIFEECATQPSMWYDAPTQAKLIEVYQTIAKELANIHLSK